MTNSNTTDVSAAHLDGQQFNHYRNSKNSTSFDFFALLVAMDATYLVLLIVATVVAGRAKQYLVAG